MMDRRRTQASALYEHRVRADFCLEATPEQGLREEEAGIEPMLAFLGTYPPRKCGIATFTKDACNAVAANDGHADRLFAVAITDRPESYQYPDRVKLEIRQHVERDYVLAADYLNHSPANVLWVQHEYGIFGGTWGSYLLSLLRDTTLPVVTTMHTVLESPEPACKRVLEELVERSDKLVVMSERAIDMLTAQGVARDKLVHIHHGVPDVPFVDPAYYKDQFRVAGKKVILTFGLLGPGKGVETMIEAMPGIIKEHPETVYLIVGATHPALVRERGEEYRLGLQRMVQKLGLSEHVIFHNRFVSDQELREFLCAADLYVTPYPHREQITSGTLAYAVGTGKAVISTPYWYAEELLGDGRGRLVEFKNPQAIAHAVNDLIDNEVEMDAMRKRAYQYGRNMVWSAVGAQYVDLAKQVLATQQREGGFVAARSVDAIISPKVLPEPSLSHVKTLTDDFGMFQHARRSVPDYHHGYCVDDNVRGLVVAAKYYRLTQDPEAIKLLSKYLAFTAYCQLPDGRFRNFVSIERHYLDEVGSDDCQGRALWGLGYVMAEGLRDFGRLAKECFDLALPTIDQMSPRGAAYAILGMHYYLQTYPGALAVRNCLTRLADQLVDGYRAHASGGWQWFEPVLAYHNAVMPQALLLAARHVENAEWAKVGEATANFVFGQCTRDGHTSLVGNGGWRPMEVKEKAHFDQQPIDACGLVELAKVAYRNTKSPEWLRRMQMAFDWFMGDNDVGAALYDPTTQGCFDGLQPDGPNDNQGAESTLCYLMALLTLTEVGPTDKEHELRRVKIRRDRTVPVITGDMEVTV